MEGVGERLLRPKEVCSLLGVSYPTLRRWIRRARLEPFKQLVVSTVFLKVR